MRVSRLWCLPLLILALPGSGQEPFRPAEQPADPARGWTPAPGPWRVAERANLVAGGGTSWQIVVSDRELGTIPADRAPTRITMPKVEFRRIRSSDTTSVATLLPTGNRDVGIFPSTSPKVNELPSRMGADALGRWPNGCRISILDAGGALDLDSDGQPEIALRRFCSCPGSACAGILLVELGDRGPALLDPESLVESVDLGSIVIEALLPDENPATPNLQVAVENLESCRFVAVLGIRGSSDCDGCCRFPVFLRPGAGGTYEPFYDTAAQSGWLRRAQDDIAAVAAGDAGRPLLSLEEAQVARAAAFFYLTGAGEPTRGMIADGLGVRARGFRTQELLRRLEEMFLPPPHAGQ